MAPGVLTYASAAVMFLVLTVLLLTGRSRGRIARMLALASVLTTLWAAVLAAEGYTGIVIPYGYLFVVEGIRNTAWLVFLLQLLLPGMSEGPRWPLIAVGLTTAAGLAAGLAWGHGGPLPLDSSGAIAVNAVVLSIQGVIGIMLAEQLFRNAIPEDRWAIKYLCLGLGGLFAYDIYLYADAVLYRRLDISTWDARGMITAVVAPMVAVSAARSRSWSARIFVSRHVVFYSSTLMAVGVAVLLIGLGAVFIDRFGGGWTRFLQSVFLFAAIVLLIAVLMSASLRARVKVFLGKHFYSNKYDYREEWLAFVKRLSLGEEIGALGERVIEAVGSLLEATGGWLWMLDERGRYQCTATWKRGRPADVIPASHPLIRFLEKNEWVIEARDADAQGNHTDRHWPDMPDPIRELSDAWLIVPLPHAGELTGFVVLATSRAPRSLDWEDWDILKSVGRTAAVYLSLVRMSEALSEARQFEAFNRLSAFVVHDLKNTVAQLELVTRNAEKHRNNEAFVEDAFETVGNAVRKMHRLLEALRKGRFEASAKSSVSLDAIVRDAVNARKDVKPGPTLEIVPGQYQLSCERDRMQSVLQHLIENAQQATPADGKVEISMRNEAGRILLSVTDTGCGMDSSFIETRLFRAFDTTKGNAGMGIGAYETREFVRSMGGEVKVESEPGAGTRFSLIFPMVESSEGESGRVSAGAMGHLG